MDQGDDSIVLLFRLPTKTPELHSFPRPKGPATFKALRAELQYRWIAEYVAEFRRNGRQMKSAVLGAVEEFDVEERTVYTACEHNPHIVPDEDVTPVTA